MKVFFNCNNTTINTDINSKDILNIRKEMVRNMVIEELKDLSVSSVKGYETLIKKLYYFYNNRVNSLLRDSNMFLNNGNMYFYPQNVNLECAIKTNRIEKYSLNNYKNIDNIKLIANML
jgi:hypothetical protein